jgi:hypothetical protein
LTVDGQTAYVPRTFGRDEARAETFQDREGTRMRKVRIGRRAGLVISAIVLLVALIPLSNVFGDPLVQNTNSGLVDAGNIHLHFDGSSASFQHFQTGATSPDSEQAFPSFSSGNCPDGGNTFTGALGSLTAGPSSRNTLSYNLDPSKEPIGVGVSSTVGGNSGCGRIDWSSNSAKSETLKYMLGSSYSSVAITSATLIFDAKYSAVINVKLLQADGTQIGTTETLPTTNQSDSGPDCASCDHWYAMSIPSAANAGVAFKGVLISVTPPPGGSQAAASLGGGIGVTASSTGSVVANEDTVFNLVQSDGVLNCDQTATGTPTGTTLYRGQNKNGSNCTLVNYDVNQPDSSTVELLWDTNSQPYATFKLTKVWDPESASYPLGHVTKVDYGTGPHTAMWCTGQSFGVIGTVNADNGGTISVTGLASNLPMTPFDIVIGTERLTVTDVSGSQLTVTRAVGSTTQVTHNVGDPISTTIFPINGDNKVEVMCLAKETATAVSPGFVQVTDEIWVEGDAKMVRG